MLSREYINKIIKVIYWYRNFYKDVTDSNELICFVNIGNEKQTALQILPMYIFGITLLIRSI